jgi:hypothetical protein
MDVLRSELLIAQSEGSAQLLTTLRQNASDIQSIGSEAMKLLIDGANLSNAFIL